jgi:hypothetical protein
MVKSDQTRSTITIWLSSLILLGSMTMSYGNQAEYLLSIGVGWGSWILPLMLDLMVLTANVALGVIALTTKERNKIRRIMWAALLASAWTNFAGGHNLRAGIYHASAVMLYLAAEKIVTIVIEAISRAKAERATEAAEAEAAKLTAPAIECAEEVKARPSARKAPATRKAHGPRDGIAYSERHARRLAAAEK